MVECVGWGFCLEEYTTYMVRYHMISSGSVNKPLPYSQPWAANGGERPQSAVGLSQSLGIGPNHCEGTQGAITTCTVDGNGFHFMKLYHVVINCM